MRFEYVKFKGSETRILTDWAELSHCQSKLAVVRAVRIGTTMSFRARTVPWRSPAIAVPKGKLTCECCTSSCLIAQAFSGQLVDNLYLMVSRLDGLTSWFCHEPYKEIKKLYVCWSGTHYQKHCEEKEEQHAKALEACLQMWIPCGSSSVGSFRDSAIQRTASRVRSQRTKKSTWFTAASRRFEVQYLYAAKWLMQLPIWFCIPWFAGFKDPTTLRTFWKLAGLDRGVSIEQCFDIEPRGFGLDRFELLFQS